MIFFRLILRRVALGIITLWLVSAVVFAATQALPGDAAKAIMGAQATPAQVAALRTRLNLDRPLVEQYGRWIGGVATGNLGMSLSLHRTPVTSLIKDRAMNSLALVSFAALIGIPISLVIGVLSARWRDTWFDVSVSIGTLVLAALPEFVLGVVFVLLFATSVFHIFPAVSPVSRDISIWSQANMFVLPCLTLVVAVAPYITRLLRVSMIEVLESEYVAMARLKGMPEGIVLRRHALPNALVPTIQATALQVAWLAGGIVVVEYLFGFPGMGQGLVQAVQNRDIPVIQALTLLIASVYVVANLVADIVTILVTPRLRAGMR